MQPPPSQWRVTPRIGREHPVIATGHQPTLWHPGILAKYLAADAFAQHMNGTTFQVVVDHNPLGPLAIDLPTREQDALGVRRLTLDPRAEAHQRPPNRLPPLDADIITALLDDEAAASNDTPHACRARKRIAEAYAKHPDAPDLAAQTTAVLQALCEPYVSRETPALPSSKLITPGFIERLLADPVGCVRAYNRATYAFPNAGIRPLYAGRDAVEAPLWAQRDLGPTPVYIDLGDSRNPQLFTSDQAIDLIGPDAIRRLRPRAATLSAIMRSEHCDLFIHGKGGGDYDNVTEHWWNAWTGQTLAPKAVVSADLTLDFDAPVAAPDQLRRALWFEHHLPFNVDRHIDAPNEHERSLIQEKHDLLDHMQDDRDKRRRAKAFMRIHAINAQLRERHTDQVSQAKHAANQARAGLRNAEIVRRRDWCFALYKDEPIQSMRQSIVNAIKP